MINQSSILGEKVICSSFSGVEEQKKYITADYFHFSGREYKVSVPSDFNQYCTECTTYTTVSEETKNYRRFGFTIPEDLADFKGYPVIGLFPSSCKHVVLCERCITPFERNNPVKFICCHPDCNGVEKSNRGDGSYLLSYSSIPSIDTINKIRTELEPDTELSGGLVSNSTQLMAGKRKAEEDEFVPKPKFRKTDNRFECRLRDDDEVCRSDLSAEAWTHVREIHKKFSTLDEQDSYHCFKCEKKVKGSGHNCVKPNEKSLFVHGETDFESQEHLKFILSEKLRSS